MPIVVSHGNPGPFLGAAVGAGYAEEQRKQEEIALRRAALEQQVQQQLRDDYLRARGQDLDYYKTNAGLADRADHDMFMAEENSANRQADREARQSELAYRTLVDQYNRDQDREHRTNLQMLRGDQAMDRVDRRVNSQEGMQNTRNQAAMDRLDRRLESQYELQGIRGDQAMERVDRRLEGAGWLQDLRAEQRSEMQRQGQQDRLDLYEYRFTRQQRQNLENIANSLSMLDQRRESGEITDAVWREGRRRLTGMANAIQPARLPRGTDADGGVSANGHLGIGDRVVAGIPDNVLETLRANPNIRLGSAPGTWVDTESGITWRFNPKSGQSDIVHNRSEDFSRYIELAGRQLQPGAQADQVIARARELYDAALGVSRGRAAANSTGAIPPRPEPAPLRPSEDPAMAPPPPPPPMGARPRDPLPTSQTRPLPPRSEPSSPPPPPPSSVLSGRITPEMEASIQREVAARLGIGSQPYTPPPPQVSHPGNPAYAPGAQAQDPVLTEPLPQGEYDRGTVSREPRQGQPVAPSYIDRLDAAARRLEMLRYGLLPRDQAAPAEAPRLPQESIRVERQGQPMVSPSQLRRNTEDAMTQLAMLRQGYYALPDRDPSPGEPPPPSPGPLPEPQPGPIERSSPGNPQVYSRVAIERADDLENQERRRKRDAAQSTTQATQALDDVIAREMSVIRSLERPEPPGGQERFRSGAGLGGMSGLPPTSARLSSAAISNTATGAIQASRARVAELESVKKDISEAGKLLAAKPFDRLSESEQAIVLRAWTRARELQLDEQRGRMGPPAPDPANRVDPGVRQQRPPIDRPVGPREPLSGHLYGILH